MGEIIISFLDRKSTMYHILVNDEPACLVNLGGRCEVFTIDDADKEVSHMEMRAEQKGMEVIFEVKEGRCPISNDFY
jgi:hypothetical protein